MPGPEATAFTPTLASPIIAFVVAAEAPTASHDDDFLFGDLEGLQDNEHLDELPDYELVEEVVGEIQQIKGNSGVGSPEVRKYVDAWSPPVSPLDTKEAHLRVLAQNLYQRRPVLYLKGHSQPYPAQVLLRTVRKPSVGALSAAAVGPAGLFKYPSNSFIVIKFDPQFGYADIIVDPFFTDAFIQQPATATYSKVLSKLPRAFVGTAPELRRMVALLTQQSISAYAAKGATCPPWRRFDAMLARWVPKKFTDEVITHGPGATESSAVNSVAAPQLLRFDSASSTASNDGAFSLSSSSQVGSFSSSASSVPRTIVHGFDIPAKVAAASAVAAPVVVPAAATVDAVTPAAKLAVSVDAAAVAVLEQQYDSLGDVIAAKLARAAVAADNSVDAAGSSWQLATELVVGEAHGGDYSISISSNTSAYAASYATKDPEISGQAAARMVPNACAPAVAVAGATAVKAPLAMLQLQLLRQRGAATAAGPPKDPSDQLLAAAGYSTRSVKLMGPKAATPADTARRVQAGADMYSSRTPIPGMGYNPVCCDWGGKENAACIDVDANSSSAVLSTAADRTVAGWHDKGLADALAKIRESVMRCPAVPASGPSARVISASGRKVVRLDYAGAVVCRAVV